MEDGMDINIKEIITVICDRCGKKMQALKYFASGDEIRAPRACDDCQYKINSDHYDDDLNNISGAR
jgi:hypothetical protein